jgi:hypothetical protein
MTLVAAIEARDGIVLLADGLTTRGPGGGTREAVKIVPVPGAPIAALLCGRASYTPDDLPAGQSGDVATWTARFLEDLRSSQHSAGLTPERTARWLTDEFTALAQRSPDVDGSLVVIVVGYLPSEDAQVVRIAVPPHPAYPSGTEFDEQRYCVGPGDVIESGGLIVRQVVREAEAEIEARAEALPAEAADEVWSEWTVGPHRYIDRSGQFLVEELRRAVRAASKEHADMLAAEGVGGRWRVLQMSANSAPGELQDLFMHD